MEPIRKPFQGIWNIIRFNWHFYVLALLLIGGLILMNEIFNHPFEVYVELVCVMIIATTLVSLIASYYIYDLSDLYSFDWVDKLKKADKEIIVNVNAGFDETSELLTQKIPDGELRVLDFYDPQKHTEISIKRARKAYPPFPNAQQISTSKIPLATGSVDKIFAIFSAHEIREEAERIVFFQELKRILKPSGQIFITEHLRDIPNFMVYNIGFFHFHSKAAWLNTFRQSGLDVKKEIKINSFISTFFLETYADSP